MKRFSLYCALIAFVAVLSSCTDSSNPTAQLPQDEPAMTAPVANVSLIPLPESSTPGSMAKATDVKVWVTPESGGDVSLSNSYVSIFGTRVTVDMNLHFEPGTVKSPALISISLDGRSLLADFEPSGLVFNKPAILTATVTGLNLFFIPKTSEIALYYVNNGVYEQMNGKIKVDRKTGVISLSDGEIPHFSLYGFGFTK